MGSPGTGKSTLAKRLHDVLGLPLIHLDQCYWKPNWQKREESEWHEIVANLVKGDEWIIDGNHRKTFELRLPTADVIIFLDIPRAICCWRVLKRIIKKNRQDRIEGCEERIDLEFLIWILWKFPQVSKKKILKRLEEVKHKKKVFILKSSKDIEEFINSLKKYEGNRS